MLLLLSACSTTSSVVHKKYPVNELKKDYTIFRKALEESHPSLYWFTSKDSMDNYFKEGFNQIKDSMTERQFRTLLLKTITPIRCGHTAVSYSKQYSAYLDTADLKLFPLVFKAWKDTLALIGNLNRTDSVLTRGTVITQINNRSAKQLIDTFFHYITGDGYSIAGRYQSLSSFGTFYKNVFGLTDSFAIRYIDEYGSENETIIPVYKPLPDSTKKQDSLNAEKYTARDKRNIRSFSSRSLQVDTTLKSSYMTLNTFASGNRLKRFFRHSFRSMQDLSLKHLVIDVRSNGGGDAGISTLLTQYLSDHSFIIADSLYAIKRSSRYRKYIHWQPAYWLMMTIITKKHRDGYFHFGYFERHRYRPFKKHHFNGNIYLLTGGNSFSATTLFVKELKGQPNVKIIGEETGGGAYGNTAWLIPELKLPYTRLRLSIPKFRLVMNRNLVKEGRGVMPDIYAAPTAEDIQNGKDVKLETVRTLIMQANGQQGRSEKDLHP